MTRRRMKKTRPTQRYMTVSTVCELYRLNPRTLNRFERQGFIEGEVIVLEDGSRAMTYNDRDISRIRTICSLTRDLGVNLAGIEIILHLLERLERQA